MNYEIWDVFTSTKFAGNPLAIVRGAAGLTTGEMQKIAAEFNLSETSFILPPEKDTHIARVRIFTPSYEMPFAGHPTIGTALSFAQELSLAQAGNGPQGFTFGLNAGPVDIRLSGPAERRQAQFTAPGIPRLFDEVIDPEKAAQALSLPVSEIDITHAPPALCGIEDVPFLYLKTTKARVSTATLAIPDYRPLGLSTEIVGLYVYTEDNSPGEGEDGADSGAALNLYARMFAPEAGIIEDPATGAAAVGLAAHLPQGAQSGENAACDRWVIRQGVDMGRPSLIEMGRLFESTADGPRLAAVTIAGGAVKIMEGTFT